MSNNSETKRLADILNDQQLLTTPKLGFNNTYNASNSTTNSSRPEGISLVSYDTFDTDMQAFYNRPDVITALNVEYPAPDFSKFERLCPNEASLSATIQEIFAQTINNYFLEEENNIIRIFFSMHLERRASYNNIPDFLFSLTGKALNSISQDAVFPTEVKPFAVFNLLNRNPVFQFNHRPNDDLTKPIYQIINYMKDHNFKYGVLTTMLETYIFRFTENPTQYKVSRMVRQEEWLKVMYYVCYESRKYYKENELDRPVKPPPQRRSRNNSGASTQTGSDGGSGNGKGSESSRGIKRIGQSPLVQTGSKFPRSAHDNTPMEALNVLWENWLDESGQVVLGFIRQQDGKKLPVSVKVATISEDALGLQNEADFLFYSQERGLKSTPKIYYSGLISQPDQPEVFANVTELLDHSRYYRRCLSSLSQIEQKLLESAKEELVAHGIAHNSLQSANILFPFDESSCKLINFENATFVPMTDLNSGLEDSAYCSL